MGYTMDMNRIYLASPHMGGDEIKYINQAFESNWIAPLGENVTQFEKTVADFVGVQHAVALSSGTAAIHLGLKAFGVGEGDVVFCSSFTFAGSANPITYLGAKPVFIDSDEKSFNMCAKALEKAYEKYPNPKALLVVNLYGNSADFDKILPIAKKHNTPVLEDAAESLGAIYNGKQTGCFGDISILSFNGNKIITTSGGGMALTNNKKWADKMLFWATQARENAPWYEHNEIGYNYRLSNICAGIGRGQMKVLEKRVERKRQIFELYSKAFAYNKNVVVMGETDGCASNRWLSVVTLAKECKVDFMQIIDALAKENIEARPTWKPMHMQPVFADCEFFSAYDTPDCEKIFAKGICLPSDTKLSDDDILRIADIVNRITGK